MGVKYYPVLINWLDIYEPSISWTEPTEAKKLKAMPCTSVGYLVYKDQSKVIVAKDLSLDGDLNGLCVIPRGCIKSIKRIRR